MRSTPKSPEQHHPSMARWDNAVFGAALLLAALVARAGIARAELRDPFTFGPHHDATENDASDRPALTGILWDVVAPFAIIDGEPFRVGETVEGWLIVEIDPDHVVFQRGMQRHTLVSGDALPAE